jgi:hypothetical protein
MVFQEPGAVIAEGLAEFAIDQAFAAERGVVRARAIDWGDCMAEMDSFGPVHSPSGITVSTFVAARSIRLPGRSGGRPFVTRIAYSAAWASSGC